MSIMSMSALRRLQTPLRRLTTKAAEASSLANSTPAPPGNSPNHRSVMALDGNTIRPFVQPNAYIAPSASLIGSVVVNDMSAVMYGAVIRGDLAVIHVGAHVTIGENATLSAGKMEGGISIGDAVGSGLSLEAEMFVGDYSVVGTGASLRGCWMEGDNIVGSGAVLEEGVVMGRWSEVLAGGVVGKGVEIGEGEIWGGCPAKKVGQVEEDDRVDRRREAVRSFAWMKKHSYEFLPVGTVYWEKEQLEAAVEEEAKA